ncbi:hsp90 co-chaperone Cdc37 [Tulasnella sp. 331]|nr:hsp90 co-chaperone Cdc37 [Tulasnella sp. 331]
MARSKQTPKAAATIRGSATKNQSKISITSSTSKATLETLPAEDDDSGGGEDENDEDDGDEEDVDEEGMERLMKALGDDGLDDFAKAQLALGSDDDNESAEDIADNTKSDMDGLNDGPDEEAASGDEGEDGDEDESVDGAENGDEGDSEDDEDEDDEYEVDQSMEIDEDVAEAADTPPKVVVNNKIALQRIRDTIKLDSSLPWTETLVTTYPETMDDVDHNDDLNREVAFYKQALHCAQQSLLLAQKHSLPFTRPDDYFAEMVKSDIHMERIRTKLLDESAFIKKSEEAKKQRNLKKYGKQIQMDRIKERAKDKRNMLDSIKSLKRKRGGVETMQDDDAFDIALDDAAERPSKRSDIGDRGRGRGHGRGRGKDGASKLPRQARDAKFQWGSGGNRHAKSNTRESTDAFDSGGRGRGRGGSRGGGGGGKIGGRGGGRGGSSSSRGGAKRLGKSRDLDALALITPDTFLILRYCQTYTRPPDTYSVDPPMPLNYSKWDQLELSDDSDIEGHPNVDHKSLVRWKQRDIHEKREAQKRRIAEYELIIATNETLIPRLRTIHKEVEDGGPEKYSSIVERLRAQPSPDKPKGGTVPYDQMLSDVLMKIRDDLKAKGVDKPDASTLAGAIKEHMDKLTIADNEAKDALQDELTEKKKKITSDDIHEGFSASSVTKEPPPEPATPKNAKATSKKTEIEVLNPKASAAAPVPTTNEAVDVEEADDEDDDPERIPDLTPTLLEFSHIPLGQFEQSFTFIQGHARQVIATGTYDQLVIAGFRAAIKGNKKYAKQCVHQALLIQYCEKLGKDGVRLFFKRMTGGDPRAQMAFTKDLEDTYKMLLERSAAAAQEDDAGGKERIQLVAEDPSQQIGFNVPDGPPPADLRIEGPGTESLDPEEVRQALQRRWEIFEGFEDNFKAALKTGKLDAVNEILGDMEVPRAEEIVRLLDIAGILSFSRSGVVDETRKGEVAEEMTTV